MKFSYLKIIAVFLIISVLSISIPNYVNASFVFIALAVVAVSAAVVYDYVSCNFNVLWGGCGDGGGRGSAPEPKLNSQTAIPVMSADGTCTTAITLNYQTIDALKYRIYSPSALM